MTALDQWANDFSDGGPTLTIAVVTTPSAGTSETWTVTSTGSPLPALAPFRMRFDNEVVWVTNVATATTLTVSRGLEGTISSHPIGTQGRVVVTAGALYNLARPEDIESLTLPDPQTVGTGTRGWRVPEGWGSVEILGVSGDAAGAPVGSSAIYDVNKNGTTIYTTQGNRPTFAAGAIFAAETTPDAAARVLVAGDRITVDRDQVGTTTAIIGVTLFMRYRRLT